MAIRKILHPARGDVQCPPRAIQDDWMRKRIPALPGQGEPWRRATSEGRTGSRWSPGQIPTLRPVGSTSKWTVPDRSGRAFALRAGGATEGPHLSRGSMPGGRDTRGRGRVARCGFAGIMPPIARRGTFHYRKTPSGFAGDRQGMSQHSVQLGAFPDGGSCSVRAFARSCNSPGQQRDGTLTP